MINNNESAMVEKNRSIYIRFSSIFIVVLCFLMILPDDAFSWLSLYKSTTPSSIAYKWLDYSFGIVQLIILVLGFFCAIKLNDKHFFYVFFIILIREIVFFMITENNIFSASAFEVYLTALIGYAFFLLVEAGLRTKKDKELFFKWFLITNVLTLYINYAMGGSGGIIAGRYHSSNLDVGGTGTICVLCIMFLVHSVDKKWYDYLFIILSIIGLFLSGSRSNLLFMILIPITFSAMNLFIRYRTEKKHTIQRQKVFNRLIVVVILLIISTILLFFFPDLIYERLLGGRFQALFNRQSFRTDDSVTGRAASLIAGLDVLKHHPFGISGYFINLQQEMRLRGYPTFPHSTLLAMYLLYGPIIFVPYYKWIKDLLKLRAYEKRYSQILLYFVISSIVYGGPIMNFKVVFVYFMVTSLASLSNSSFISDE